MKEPLIKQGWLRASIFLVVLLMIEVGVLSLLYKFLLVLLGLSQNDDNIYKYLLMSVLSIVIIIPVVYFFRRLVDRKSFFSLGFAWKHHSNDAWSGFLSASLVMCSGTLILLISKNLKFVDFQIDIKNISVAAVVMIAVAISEEVVVRGYILNNLMASFNKWIALLISAALFAALHLHNPNLTWLSFIGIFAGGILLGINYVYTKNLWFGIFGHFAWNFLQGPVFGYPVSGLEIEGILAPSINGPGWLTGGAFGFESSLLGVALIALVVFFLNYRYRRIGKTVLA